MIGTLLEDLATGMDFATVSARFAAKMHPLKYLRPQAAPRAGNIADAEKIVAKLGIARSLERRFARIDEIETLWTDAPRRRLRTAWGSSRRWWPGGTRHPLRSTSHRSR